MHLPASPRLLLGALLLALFDPLADTLPPALWSFLLLYGLLLFGVAAVCSWGERAFATRRP